MTSSPSNLRPPKSRENTISILHFQKSDEEKLKSISIELASDHRFENREEVFRVTIFNNVLDIIISQCSL